MKIGTRLLGGCVPRQTYHESRSVFRCRGYADCSRVFGVFPIERRRALRPRMRRVAIVNHVDQRDMRVNLSGRQARVAKVYFANTEIVGLYWNWDD